MHEEVNKVISNKKDDQGLTHRGDNHIVKRASLLGFNHRKVMFNGWDN